MLDIYQKITDLIIAELDRGCVPWRKPWNDNQRKAMNLVTKKPYQGFNYIRLNFMTSFTSPYWLTMKQANSLGGRIRKGAKAAEVIFWKIYHKECSTGTETHNDESAEKTIPVLRFYHVFNLEQTEGIDTKHIPVHEESQELEFSPIEASENIIRNFSDCPEIRHYGCEAYYSYTHDMITLPEKSTFISVEEYYSTLFHECVHSTGHTQRLARKEFDAAAFGSATYSKEELIAEIGNAFLCAESGILQPTLSHSAAYIKGWLSKLKDDKKLIITAAGAAQRAVDYILENNDSKGGNDIVFRN